MENSRTAMPKHHDLLLALVGLVLVAGILFAFSFYHFLRSQGLLGAGEATVRHYLGSTKVLLFELIPGIGCFQLFVAFLIWRYIKKCKRVGLAK